jgi:hypothetical protein
MRMGRGVGMEGEIMGCEGEIMGCEGIWKLICTDVELGK